MIKSLIFSKKVRMQDGRIVITIPPEIVDEMNISSGDMVQVTLTNRTHIQRSTATIYGQDNTDINYSATINITR